MLLDTCAYFSLPDAQAKMILGEVLDAVTDWRRVAVTPEVGLGAHELDDFEDAFEHVQTDQARKLLGRVMLRPELAEDAG
jgi:serine/threonine-protein kinase HipA